MADLIFTSYAPNDDIPEEAFEIGSDSDRGDLWLVDNTDTTVPEAEGNEPPIPAVNSWINTKDEFERLYAKAVADGLTVERLSV